MLDHEDFRPDTYTRKGYFPRGTIRSDGFTLQLLCFKTKELLSVKYERLPDDRLPPRLASTVHGTNDFLTEIRNVLRTKEDMARLWPDIDPRDIKTPTPDAGPQKAGNNDQSPSFKGPVTNYIEKLEQLEDQLSNFYNGSNSRFKKHTWDMERAKHIEHQAIANNLLKIVGGSIGERRKEGNPVLIGVGLGQFVSSSRLSSLHSSFLSYFVPYTHCGRIEEVKSENFVNNVRFFAVYSGGRVKTFQLRPTKKSPYIFLHQAHVSEVLPSALQTWIRQIQRIAHLLRVRALMTETVLHYQRCLTPMEKQDEDGSGGENDLDDPRWLYRNPERFKWDQTLGSSPLAPLL
ncbi:hypothetical protein BGZ58_003994 [Dissophora ornata]|nr:hypothetical protein BGZ58_003994 [Dissophora ornata]